MILRALAAFSAAVICIGRIATTIVMINVFALGAMVYALASMPMRVAEAVMAAWRGKA
jgi:hypothetical protein